MSRRPLAASLPPDERPAALEQRIRDYQAAVADLEDAMAVLHTGRDVEGRKVTAGHSQAAVWRAFVALQEINARLFRRPETVATSPTPAEGGR